MDQKENESKKGFTVQELEGKVKKYGLEIALCIIFILNAIFALVWGGGMLVWSILLSMIFAIVGTLLPKSINKITTGALRFIYREKVTTIIFAIVGILLSIFIPPIMFALVGLIAGKSFSIDSQEHVRPDSSDSSSNSDGQNP